jgi:hypothetical protein
MTKYEPLEIYLRNRLGRESEITMSFDRIEFIIKSKLPNSAFWHQAWWAHEVNPKTHVQKIAWQNAGWKVESYNIARRIVKFVPLK